MANDAGYPFLQSAFLQALANSGTTGNGTAWEPVSLTAGETVLPTWRKQHGWGEYVFDFAWADAYRRHGLNWYPKLVTAVPYTPVPGPRWQGPDPDPGYLFAQVREAVRVEQASSWHLLFPDTHTLELLQELPLISRSACHFRWFNHGYDSWEDFSAALTSRRRKSIRKERAAVAQQGIVVERAVGTAIPADWWAPFYEFYAATYYKRGQSPYLSRHFFELLQQGALAQQLAMVMAFRDGKPVAAAFYLFDGERLYGRYWGCLAEYHALHFELCYYQGIELAIQLQVKQFDPGVQGEHKILRGFEPVITTSLHWIAEPAFHDAIRRYCDQEKASVLAYQEEARSLLPFRQENGGEWC